MTRPLASLLLILLAGCPAPTGPDGDDDVLIRIANESAFLFERVVVKSPGIDEVFGPLSPASTSEYRAVDHAYRYAYVEVHLADDKLVLQPIDYVGESPLPGGRYTYVLDIDPQGPHLLFSLREQ